MDKFLKLSPLICKILLFCPAIIGVTKDISVEGTETLIISFIRNEILNVSVEIVT